jgi:hypothetical protein
MVCSRITFAFTQLQVSVIPLQKTSDMTDDIHRAQRPNFGEGSRTVIVVEVSDWLCVVVVGGNGGVELL